MLERDGDKSQWWWWNRRGELGGHGTRQVPGPVWQKRSDLQNLGRDGWKSS